MTYHALGASTADQIEKCIETGTEGDLESKRGREKAFTDTAKCSANAYCASYGIPPETEICGTIAGEIAEFAIDAWNAVFGNQDEVDAYNQRMKAGAYLRAQRRMTRELREHMWSAFQLGATRLAEWWEAMDPAMRGKLGVWAPIDAGWVAKHPEWQGQSRYLTPRAPSMVYALLATNGVRIKMFTPTGGAPEYQPEPNPMIDCPTKLSLEATGQCLYDWTRSRAVPWLEALQRALPKAGDIILASATRAQVERAAARKEAWADAMEANRLIDQGDYEGAKTVMRGDLPRQALDPYAVSANRGRSRTLLLNGSLLVTGAALAGAAWYYGRRRS